MRAHGGLDLCVYVGVLVAVWGEVVLGVCDVCFSVGRVSGSVCVCVCVCVCGRAGEREVTGLLSAACPPGFPSVSLQSPSLKATQDFRPTNPAGQWLAPC